MDFCLQIRTILYLETNTFPQTHWPFHETYQELFKYDMMMHGLVSLQCEYLFARHFTPTSRIDHPKIVINM